MATCSQKTMNGEIIRRPERVIETGLMGKIEGPRGPVKIHNQKIFNGLFRVPCIPWDGAVTFAFPVNWPSVCTGN